jgi:tetratricopeptide (TPR) repeat protein
LKARIIILFIGLTLLFSCARKAVPEQAIGIEKKEEKLRAFEQYYQDGLKYFILGNYPDAQAYFDKAYQVSPENGALNYMQGQMALAGKESAKAVNYALKATKADTKNKYYAILLAKAYEQKLDADEAIKVYKRIIAEMPNSEEYYFDLANLYVYQRNYNEALRIYEKIEQSYGKSLELTRQKQQIYLRDNKYEKALEEGELLMKAFPEDNDIKAGHAEFLYTNKKEAEAIALLEEVVKKDPNNPRSHLILADIYQMKGEDKKANEELLMVFKNTDVDLATKLSILEDFMRNAKTEEAKKSALLMAQAIVETHNSDSKAYAALGEAQLLAENKKEAWSAFNQSKNLDGNNYNLWIQLLTLDSELQLTDSLVAHTEQALELFPNQAVLWLYNGTGYVQKKEYIKAIESFEEGRKLSGSNQELKNYFNIHLGDTYNNVKEFEKSDAAYEEVLKVDRNNDHVLNNYSYFLSLRKDKLPLAKEMSEKLIKRNPTEATYLDTHAWVLYVMKDYEGAKKHLEIAVLNSDNGTIIEHYGDVLYQLGEKERALEQWEKAKKLGETSEFIDKKIAEGKLYE